MSNIFPIRFTFPSTRSYFPERKVIDEQKSNMMNFTQKFNSLTDREMSTMDRRNLMMSGELCAILKKCFINQLILLSSWIFWYPLQFIDINSSFYYRYLQNWNPFSKHVCRKIRSVDHLHLNSCSILFYVWLYQLLILLPWFVNTRARRSTCIGKRLVILPIFCFKI